MADPIDRPTGFTDTDRQDRTARRANTSCGTRGAEVRAASPAVRDGRHGAQAPTKVPRKEPRPRERPRGQALDAVEQIALNLHGAEQVSPRLGKAVRSLGNSRWPFLAWPVGARAGRANCLGGWRSRRRRQLQDPGPERPRPTSPIAADTAQLGAGPPG